MQSSPPSPVPPHPFFSSAAPAVAPPVSGVTRTVYIFNPDLATFRKTTTNDFEYQDRVVLFNVPFEHNVSVNNVSAIPILESHYYMTLKAFDELEKYKIVMSALRSQTQLDLRTIRTIEVVGIRPIIRYNMYSLDDEGPIVLVKTHMVSDKQAYPDSSSCVIL